MNEYEIIHAYTRANAIADGALIDVTDYARDAGFKYPTAMTIAAWAKTVEVPPTDLVHNQIERLETLLKAMRDAIGRGSSQTEVLFSVDVCDEDDIAERVELKTICGPGDDARPVLTIMLPNED